MSKEHQPANPARVIQSETAASRLRLILAMAGAAILATTCETRGTGPETVPTFYATLLGASLLGAGILGSLNRRRRW